MMKFILRPLLVSGVRLVVLALGTQYFFDKLYIHPSQQIKLDDYGQVSEESTSR